MLLSALTVLAAVTLAQRPPEVLVPGQSYREGDLASTEGEPALELCDGELRATSLRMTPDPQFARFTLAASTCDAPVLLLRFPSLQAGPITEAKRRGDALSLGKGRWKFRVLPYADGGVRATLQSGDEPAQTVFESAAPDSGVELVWAGDLDRDGKLDLVLTTLEGLFTYETLILSGAVEPAAQTPRPNS